ncbi:hypothetical protein U14_04690 [Candidatus Moduliflexus flocculans]|uniref:Uncharacterized protein n=1 Tax=Candidatus Moduliflexus flocculans TaxID=1499966 RepID=A0A0S6W592_9BACT|nr:hypothetical protein U14_04690 [Candidatus Moduliflexus flocculans]
MKVDIRSHATRLRVRRGGDLELTVGVVEPSAVRHPPVRGYLQRPLLKYTIGLPLLGMMLCAQFIRGCKEICVSGSCNSLIFGLMLLSFVVFFFYFLLLVQKRGGGFRPDTPTIVQRQIRLTGTEVMFPSVLVHQGQQTEFALAHIWDPQLFRRTRTPAPDRAQIEFTYAGQRIVTRFPILYDDAIVFLSVLSEVIAFRSTMIERLIFGNLPVSDADAPQTLRNPETATLRLPFQRLRQIVIDPGSYDFYQLERFLTYAVNVIGEDDLKRYVTVEIHGDETQLAPHVRNVLTNLCHTVTFTHKQAH